MSEEFGRSVRDLLPGKLQDADKLVHEKLQDEPGVSNASIPGFIWGVVGSRVTEAVRGVLDCDVFEQLARAWAKARELKEYADPSKHPADQEFTEFLGEHTLVANMHPVVEIGLRGLAKTRLRFTLELTAKIQTAELRILGGRIVAVGAGEALVAAQLKYRDVKLHPELKSVPVKLSQPLLLNPGLAIG
jgi:hypothetical protein